MANGIVRISAVLPLDCFGGLRASCCTTSRWNVFRTCLRFGGWCSLALSDLRPSSSTFKWLHARTHTRIERCRWWYCEVLCAKVMFLSLCFGLRSHLQHRLVLLLTQPSQTFQQGENTCTYLGKPLKRAWGYNIFCTMGDQPLSRVPYEFTWLERAGLQCYLRRGDSESEHSLLLIEPTQRISILGQNL